MAPTDSSTTPKSSNVQPSILGKTPPGSTPVINVETGINMKTMNFHWKVNNFDLIRKYDKLLKKQSFDFETMDDDGYEYNWEISLGTTAERYTSRTSGFIETQWLGIKCSLDMISPMSPRLDDSTIPSVAFGRLLVEIKDKAGKRFFTKEVHDSVEVGRFWNVLLFPKHDRADSLLVNGSLTFEIQFQQFTPLSASYKGSLPYAIQAFEKKSKFKLCNALATLDEDMERADIKIISEDGEEIKTHSLILSWRSPVFRAMLQTDMREKGTGVIKCKDVCGKSLKALLHFMYTGQLSKNWDETDVTHDLCYAAHKYEVTDLVQFLDEILGKVCTLHNSVNLLQLANKFSLETAEKEILQYTKSAAVNANDYLVAMYHGL